MTIVAAFCNAVWLAFTLLVLAEDGLPREAAYIGGTLLMLATPLLTVAVLFRGAAGAGRLGRLAPGATAGKASHSRERGSLAAIARAAAIVCNVALLACVGWALLSQPPHPDEEGYVAFVVLSVLTPILSVLTIVRSGATGRRRALPLQTQP